MGEADDVKWRPCSILLPNGRMIAGLDDAPAGALCSLLMLHEPSRDLDQSVALFARMPSSDMRRLALDLPGHGLSSDPTGEEDARSMLHLALDRLSDDGRHRLVIAALGGSTALGWHLASHPAVVGLALVSPEAGDATMPRLPRHLSLLGFVAARDEKGVSEWARLRRSAGCRWLGVSMATTRAELLDPEGPAADQVASQLSGFARDASSVAERPASAGRAG